MFFFVLLQPFIHIIVTQAVLLEMNVTCNLSGRHVGNVFQRPVCMFCNVLCVRQTNTVMGNKVFLFLILK